MLRILRPTLPVLIGLLLAIWLGFLLHQLMSVLIVFDMLPREQASPIAARLFYFTERVVIGLSAGAVLLQVAWRFLACDRLRKATLWLTLLALVLATSSTVFISSRIDAMREAGQTQTPEFRRTHAISQVTNLGQLIVLVSGVVTFLLALRRDGDGPIAPTK
jgi:hypothetical protein